MVEDVESLIFRHLRATPADVGNIKDALRAGKQRLGSLETRIAVAKRENATRNKAPAVRHASYDRFAEHLERIECRLDRISH